MPGHRQRLRQKYLNLRKLETLLRMVRDVHPNEGRPDHFCESEVRLSQNNLGNLRHPNEGRPDHFCESKVRLSQNNLGNLRMAAKCMGMDSFWVDKPRYDEAERIYYESQKSESLTPLADEVARARQRLNEIRGNFADGIACIKAPDQPSKIVEPEVKAVTAEVPSVVQPTKTVEPETKSNAETCKPVPAQEKETSTSFTPSVDVGAVKFLEKKVTDFEKVLQQVQKQLSLFDTRLSSIEASIASKCPAAKGAACAKPAPAKPADDDDDVDLFGSESEDDEAAAKVKEERLAAYAAKKSKKPALIAKSSIILDVKPWDDETDMKILEGEVRKIEMDGLLWGASKLVPLAYGIHKLQINCVVEDEKVSIDLLQEKIESIEDYVQSVDIAAFNKI